jgi:phosphomannomutase
MPIHISADYKKAFRDADIRGIYPTEIDEEATYLIARSFVDEYGHKEVIVVRDMRLSSPALHAAFVKGVTDAGANVIDLGLATTPMLYYASGTMKLPGVAITASHNPKNFNGLKLVLPGAIPLTEAHGLKAVRRRMEKGVFSEAKKPGKVKTKDVKDAYLKHVLKGVRSKEVSGLKVAVDCGNGMSSVLMPKLEAKLPVKFTTLYTELDGRFPNHGSDPTLSKNQKGITKLLKTTTHDFGIAFDGDADRVAFFDEKGRYVNSAVIGAIIAKRLLKNKPGAKIVYTTLTSRVLEETIKSSGGKAVGARVGHAFIKETMRQKDVLFGCEHSGHFYFKEFFFTDSAVLTFRNVLEAFAEAKKEGMTFSQMVAPYLRYEQTEDVIVEVDHRPAALESVRQLLLKKPLCKVKKFDGYTFDLGSVWGSVKISVTEPALKMMFEGKKRKEAQALQDEVADFVRKIAHD